MLKSRTAASTPVLILLWLVGASATALWAETILREDFESPGNWRKYIRGKGTIALVPGGVQGKCLKTTSADQALVYYSQPLPVDRVRGKRLIIRAKVKLEHVVRGKKVYSTAKIHLGARVGKVQRNYARRFEGTADWHDELLIAEIPEDATRVVLDLGLQNATGTAYYDDLVVDDGVRAHTAVNLKPVANACYHDETAGEGNGASLELGAKDLRSLPVGDLRLGGVDFYLLAPAENYGRTCVLLRGAKRPDLPTRIETVAPVDRKLSRLFFLQAAAGVDPAHQEPCLVYEVHYADGVVVRIPMREGVDLGSFEDPEDLPNWKVAWTAACPGGKVGLGVTTWQNPRPEETVKFLRLSTPGTGAVPLVVAVSLVPRK